MEGDQIEGTSSAGAVPEDAFVQGATSSEIVDDVNTSDLSPQEIEIITFLQEQLQSEQSKHVHHPPVSVPSCQCPFGSIDMEETFWRAFSLAQQDDFVPAGYGVLEEEWEEGQYPSEQYIGNNRKHNPTPFIPLPYHLWYPRAVRSAIGLHIMNASIDQD